ncbi:hypothetical protein FOL47_000172 [Perkinsus chesapeaki]|uniref:Phosphatidylinositol-4-phosphate 5-kinase-like protein 1 n=1 Tax=Perkinsus chesapeaki TaxID=330153 RepID=A0A7J6KY11_PERCH|nr:hypothetical protein FOL47_000172 [Perkinsus chesapeaki]
MADEEPIPYSLVTEEGETRETAAGFTGKGTATYPNGDVYEGSYADGRKSGQGVYTYRDGSAYNGNYKNGQREGIGKFTMAADGSFYHGSFVDGLYDGEGTMSYATTGDVYTGEWKKGLRHGTGTYIYKKGQASVTGTWQDDKIVKGRWRLSPAQDSPVFDGEFDTKYSQPIGEGVWTLSDGKKISGRYTQNHEPSDTTDDVITKLHWATLV